MPRGPPEKGEAFECEQGAVEVVVTAVGANGAAPGDRLQRKTPHQKQPSQSDENVLK